jgi:hypothetical protein
MRIKIVSDGIKTQVVDAETGESIDGVLAVDWAHRGPDYLPCCTLIIESPQFEYEGEAKLSWWKRILGAK